MCDVNEDGDSVGAGGAGAVVIFIFEEDDIGVVAT